MNLLRQIVQRMREEELTGEDEGDDSTQEEISATSWSYWKQLQSSSCVVA